ncbi:formyltransferase family protein [Idiomarina sp. MD25a]|uniref:formyltransferase family protein n=1 Tax=Idiomarina sp. MD25a TaxID=1889913 RepID=UPI000B2F1ECE|nr:formyltransferase family protein [Idiomarina sp. MD25a]
MTQALQVSVLCSDPNHPIQPLLQDWKIKQQEDGHQVEIVERAKHLRGGDILLLISCAEKITADVRSGYQRSLVIHASDLPKGRGWSPHIWGLLEGKDQLTVTLLDAAEGIDEGAIYKQLQLPVTKDALWDEINAALFSMELVLMDWAVAHVLATQPQPQTEQQATYYPKRTPSDSQLDADKSIAAQWDLIRVCDPNRYPAWFSLHGHQYKVIVEKMDDK